MDLADTLPFCLANEHGLRLIATLDRSDFLVYRLPGGDGIYNLLEP